MQSLKLLSPAKINLRLDVLDKRSDGYHNLRNIMDLVTGIADEVEISIVEKNLSVTCDHESVPDDEENIAFRALKEILAYSSRNVGVEVSIKKHIPVASGMGGGSSNAATVIKGINDLLKLKLPTEKLVKIGAKVGSDVPFFILEAPALAEGMGDELTPIKSLPKLPLLVINPGIRVSTAAVYHRVSSSRRHRQLEELPLSYRTKKDVIDVLHNDLQRITFREIPVLKEIEEEMIASGASASMMTGSGPTIFGIFSDKNSLHKAFEKFKKNAPETWQIFEAETVGTSKKA
ncbi:MAG: 4-(cytidine 5'-diphospho)-2-C-methyl-D-erythritol kinase [Deltaproteobacteria bacterium]|nr:4-(cytidine 5'-diphospho)-2-C-methyl-D-erythritol kinase [Deltaproteobacteria bacterium]